LGKAPTCEALFHEALALEWVDPPRTAAAHHLLVATYMLQHPSRFTAAGQRGFATVLAAVIDGNLSAQELRELNRRHFDQQNRAWRITRDMPAPPVLRRWPMTIDAILGGGPDELPDRIWRWARSARTELDG
jgi:hypothetical protein